MNCHWIAPSAEPVIEPGEAHIWAVPLGPGGTGLDPLAVLSPEERRRAAEFQLAAPRQRFVTARAALRVLLGRYLDAAPCDVSISVDAYNKPRLASRTGAPELKFNIAHSGELALVALSNVHEIGVDVERLRRVRHAEHIARRHFHQAEAAAITAATEAARDEVFLRYWTGKEAVLKAIGIGMAASLSAFEVPHAMDQVSDFIDLSALGPPTHGPCWLQWLNPGGDYLAAVATVGARLEVRCMMFAG